MASHDIQSLLLAELDAVYRLAYHLANRPQDADDFVQETFLRALKAADRFELNEYGPRPWLFKILHNVIASRYKALSRDNQHLTNLSASDESSTPTDPADVPVDRLADLCWDDVDERLKQSIDGLPLTARMAFLLYAVEGLKYKEIAVVTGVPIGTVMSRLSRARETLAVNLNAYAQERGWNRSSATAPPISTAESATGETVLFHQPDAAPADPTEVDNDS